MKGKKRQRESAPAAEPPQEASGRDPAERVVHWVSAKKRPLSLGVGAVVVLFGGVWFMQSAQSRREAFASSELEQARFAVEAGNLALAASDLGSIVGTYGGTNASREAAILLARVHLLQGQPDLAASEMRTFLDQDPADQFRAPGANLLANALEELGRFGEASGAFEEAASASPYELVRAQHMMDAARTAQLAGDLDRAAALYRSVLDDTEEPQILTEVRLRLAEVEHTPAR